MRWQVNTVQNGVLVHFKDTNRTAGLMLVEDKLFIVESDATNEFTKPLSSSCYIVNRQYRYTAYSLMYMEILKLITLGWKPKNNTRLSKLPSVCRKFILKKAHIALCHRFHAAYKELLSQIDPLLLAIDKNITRTIGPTKSQYMPSWFYDHKFRSNPYLMSDASKYRACILALMDAYDDPSQFNKVCTDWKSYFAPNTTYSALNKTLMNLPPRIPLHLLQRLKVIKLPRPIYSRLELMFFLLGNDYHNPVHMPINPHNSPINAHILCNTKQAEILKVHKWYKKHIDPASKLNSYSGVSDFYRWLRDYPTEYHGDLMGLALRSQRWHIDIVNRPGYNEHQLPLETKLYQPRILPNIKGVTFLATVRDLVEESGKMKHCVGAYARQARDGRSFIFHVEYKKDHATIEVDNSGRVVQAQGIRNRKNNATKYGIRKLEQWLKSIERKIV